MARPRKKETLATVSVRLPKAMLEAVDEVAGQLQDETPLLQVSRTEAIRYLLQMGLKAYGDKKRKPAARRSR